MLTTTERISDYTNPQKAYLSNADGWRNPIIRAATNLTGESETSLMTHGNHESESVNCVQFIVSPPLDIARFLKLLREIKEAFDCNVVQIMGSYRDGCIVTMNLPGNAVRTSISTKLMDFTRSSGLDIFVEENID